MKHSHLLLILPLAALMAACGHTNNLAKFPVAGKKALFRVYAVSDAASSISVVESPVKNTIVDIIAAVGSVIVSDQSKHKLEHAVNGDSIAHSVSLGTQNSTSDYLSLRPVAGMQDNPDIIVETEITEYKLISASVGLALYVRGKSRMIDRATGQIVWEDSENKTVQLSETYLAAFAPRAISSGASIFNAVRLLTLSEEEIRTVVDNAAMEVGREIGETLREDVASSHH
ncbi:MAG: hypothetical protein ABI876_05505 [Bacteroidota bacterium]